MDNEFRDPYNHPRNASANTGPAESNDPPRYPQQVSPVSPSGADTNWSVPAAQRTPSFGGTPLSSQSAGMGQEHLYGQPVASTTQPRRMKRRGPGWGALILAMILTAVLSVVLTLSFGTGLTTFDRPHSQSNDPVTSGPTAPLVEQKEGASDWQAVANAVRPATVAIQVQAGNSGDTGSGVMWDADGHIVTNNHVVADAQGPETVTVSLNDGRLYHAEVVGTDPTTDLAVIKLQDAPSDLVSANFGSSDSLTVGEPVMAIGSPLGLSDTVTTGIISALDRPVAVKGTAPRQSGDADLWGLQPNAQAQPEPVITNAIQIDASINPGNSGGPLFDENGRVIGINSSIASLGPSESSAGSIGLGFAIPVDLVKNVATQLITNGKAEHAQLGVIIRSAAVSVDGVTRVGAEVADVVSDGAAASADIEVGDVIIKIDGHDVVSSRSLTGYVRRYNSGDEVTLVVARDGKAVDVPVTLKQAQE